METHPERFLHEAGKAISSRSYRRGNKTALRLIEMSKGNNALNDSAPNELQDTAQDTLKYSEDLQAQNVSTEDESLLAELDTEGIKPENIHSTEQQGERSKNIVTTQPNFQPNPIQGWGYTVTGLRHHPTTTHHPHSNF